MLDQMTGPLGVFTSAMSAPITRKVTCIEIVQEATFSVLEFEFPSGEAEAADFTDPTYPPLMKLLNVKSFQVATGVVMAAFRK